MSNHHPDGRGSTPVSDQDLQAMLVQAGDLPKPDPARKAATKAQLKRSFQSAEASSSPRLWKKTLVPMSIAAALVIGIAASLLLPNTSPPILGEIVFEQGDVQVIQTDGREPNGPLMDGAEVFVPANARATLRLIDQTIVQIAPSSRLTLHAGSELQLDHGRLFVDVNGRGSSVLVRTKWAAIRDIGTQFEVRSTDQALEVAMREGDTEITLTHPPYQTVAATTRAQDADLITVASNASVQRHTIKRNAQRWQWLREGTPSLPAGERVLAKTLAWAARQSGRRIQFDSPLTQLLTEQVTVVWPTISPVGLEPQLAELSKTTAFAIEFTPAVISVTAKSQERLPDVNPQPP